MDIETVFIIFLVLLNSVHTFMLCKLGVTLGAIHTELRGGDRCCENDDCDCEAW